MEEADAVAVRAKWVAPTTKNESLARAESLRDYLVLLRAYAAGYDCPVVIRAIFPLIHWFRWIVVERRNDGVLQR